VTDLRRKTFLHGRFGGEFYDQGGAVYNVAAFGAVGDGVTDDTFAIQTTANAAMALDDNDELTDGRVGTVLFPSGRSFLTTGITVPAGSVLRIVAHGARIVLGGSNNTAINVLGTLADRAGLDVDGGVWVGTGTGSTGIQLAYATTVARLTRLTLRDFGDGLHVIDTHSGFSEDCHIYSCDGNGIYFDGPGGDGTGVWGWTLVRPFVTNNDIGVLYRGPVVDCAMIGGQIRANTTNELQVYGTTSGACQGNRFTTVHFEANFGTAPNYAAVIDTETGGSRPNTTLFSLCFWSGNYTAGCIAVGSAVSTFFVDNHSFTSVPNTIVTTSSNALNTRVVRWNRADFGIPDLSLGRGQVDSFTLSAGDNNDFTPDTAGSISDTLRLTANVSGSAITGIAHGWAGRRLRLINTSAYTLTLKHNTTSTAANRLYCGNSSTITLGQYDAAESEYDQGTQRWRTWKLGPEDTSIVLRNNEWTNALTIRSDGTTENSPNIRLVARASAADISRWILVDTDGELLIKDTDGSATALSLSDGGDCDLEGGLGVHGVVAPSQASKINDPSGGGIQDAEARTAINAIIDVLESIGFSATT
jgi:hypothetical protein